MKIAITTVSNDAFLNGTLVLLSSLLKRNPWFKGDFVVIDGGLSKISMVKIKKVSQVKLHIPSINILNRIDSLVKSLPAYQQSQSRFLSLELFNISGYDKILYLDSDMMCLNSVEDLFKINGELLACADPRFYLGCVRDKNTFLPIPKENMDLKVSQNVFKSFNTGLMLIQPNLFEVNLYNQLCSEISHANYKDIKSGHTDSVILNRMFSDRVTWLPLTYNFYTSLWEQLPHLQNETFKKELKMIHFLGRTKPWDTEKNVLVTNLFHALWHEEINTLT